MYNAMSVYGLWIIFDVLYVVKINANITNTNIADRFPKSIVILERHENLWAFWMRFY